LCVTAAAAGKAKHYAFLEFHLPEVAQIAAGAMDGYFLFKQVGTTWLVVDTITLGAAAAATSSPDSGSAFLPPATS
jgi:hypothetical protein